MADKKKAKTKKSKAKKRAYRPLEKPKALNPEGLFALKAKATRAKTLGIKCLMDGVTLKHKAGRPPIICQKDKCFRAYRNAYRRDYDPAHAAA